MFNWTNGSVLVHEGKIYCSINSKKRCTVPNKERAHAPPFTSKKNSSTLTRAGYNFAQPVWWDINYGWLGFVPLAPSYVSLPFEILCWKPRIVEAYRNVSRDATERWAHTWQVNSEDRCAWIQCADRIADAASKIRLAYHIPGNQPPSPYQFSLSDEQDSQKAVERVVEHTRKWFAVWMGFLSYLIAQTQQPEYRKHARSTPTEPNVPAWHAILVHHGFTQAWIDGLKSSTVFSLDALTPRAGVYIDFTVDDLRGDVVWLVGSHVPVWFPYNRFTEEYLQRNNMTAFIPPKSLLEHALRPILEETRFPLGTLVMSTYMGVQWTEYLETTKHFLGLENTTDAVLRICKAGLKADFSVPLRDLQTRTEILSQMRTILAEREAETALEMLANVSVVEQGMLDSSSYDRRLTTLHENWRHFFAMRDARELELLATELPAERGARLQRERALPTKNTTMYEWEAVKTAGGKVIYTRTLVNKHDHADTWISYHPEERKYYARRNEWDLFKAFARPDNAGDDFGVSSDGFDMGEPVSPGGSEYSYSRPASPSGMAPSSAGSTLAAPPALVATYTTEAEADAPRGEDTQMCDEYVDRRLSECTQWQMGFVPPLDPSWKTHEPRKISDAMFTVGSSGVAAVTDREQAAITDFVFSLASKNDPPVDLDDLNSGNHSYLLRRANFSTFKHINNWYIFHAPRSEACHWQLGFDNPATVLYVLRIMASEMQHRHTMLSLAERLLQRGVRFWTFEKLPKGSEHQLWEPFRPEPSRRVGYVFTAEDFQSSLLQIQACLRCLPGRAAMLEGGIIGRIARKFLGFDAVLNGPSVEATYTRNGLGVPAGDETEFWDDGLTEHEKATICGTYLMLTGKGDQMTKVSWFPSAESWKETSYDCVEWTPLCESFFKDIFERAGKGELQPLSNKAWRDKLRRSKVARATLARNCERAQIFLDTHVS